MVARQGRLSTCTWTTIQWANFLVGTGVSLDEIKNLLSTQEKFSQTSLAEVVSRAVQDEIKSVIPKAVKDEMRKRWVKIDRFGNYHQLKASIAVCCLDYKISCANR
jgi:hypothetical protein